MKISASFFSRLSEEIRMLLKLRNTDKEKEKINGFDKIKHESVLFEEKIEFRNGKQVIVYSISDDLKNAAKIIFDKVHHKL